MLRLLAFLLALVLAVPAAAQLGSGPRHMGLALVAEGPAIPGQEVELALVMVPEDGWHGYWENPGDAGKPMSVAWQLPPGASAGPLRYPVPTRLIVADLMNHVFKGPYAVLSRLRVPADASGVLPIRATLDYLVCTDQVCVPERGSVVLDLPVGSGPTDLRFDGWRAKLPQPLGSPGTFAVAGDRLQVAIPLPESVAVTAPYLYAITGDVVRYADAQAFRRTPDRLIAELPLAQAPAAGFEGVIDLGTGRALRFAAAPGAVPEGGSTVGGGETWRLLLFAFLGAVAGGLILNLMPCVFPILALKALALARAGGEEREARADALGYTLGAIVGTGALGAVLLLVRAGGSAAGWAFQLQDPRTVLLLFLLAVAITLNLLGLFKLPVLGGEGNPRSGFATGALAAFVATPCAGPFMGAALGTALLLPAAGALLVFAGLGLGLALPFLLLAFVPSLRKRLPRPGPWMARLQRILAVPMALSALAALWLLWRQGGTSAILLGLVSAALLAAALLFAGRRQDAGQPALSAPVVALLLLVAVPLLGIGRGEMAVTQRGSAGEAWSEAKVAAARAAGRPVFVYFTADWCLSCKVNEASTIDREPVRDALKAANAEVLVADWTNADPAITRFLDSRGRGAIPLYLWYAPGAAEPEELPQVLTPAMLIERATAARR
ncbi:DsbC/DsbD-like thiol-disulfide interchange protein/cytochrome c biogenesis protein CcdA [Sphingomonas kaistensis]|uniref:DsbC/DsbD-like thiol-disulfide interchange protein/cytochrome c biogenesis protein CcdA n=1 Tax=Sphingomonas kaistensis TaxID=298708 RepID=A0A7X5Y340_9SPHN|nr:thioredoxin family protein [Sphingomonas kaistensis]NJC04304.1 DsbC/DsbD-like thiol-disulfide interchange protein/cytochrome c biogenesis protein CcdA [Sphingomonas kaistensis]